jgi:hypothetical protein
MARDGFTVVEALVALVLASLAAAALAAAVSAGARGLAAARTLSRGVVAAQDALGPLTATSPTGPTSDTDTLAGMPPLRREWTVEPGRGRPTSLAVQVRWDSHALTLETSRWP